MAETNATILIPDISGFTEFMTTTELAHSSFAINILIDAMINAVGDEYEVSEVEGDAVLLIRKGAAPSQKELLDVCLKIFNAFHYQRKWLQQYAVCPCGACRAIRHLALKFVVHHGPLAEIKVGKFTKQSGTEMIVAHRLLKNNINNNEYLLVTEKLLQQQVADATTIEMEWNSSSEEYPSIGKIDFRFALLDNARKHVPEPPIPATYKTDDTSYFEMPIEANYQEVYMVMMNIPGRSEWLQGLRKVEQDQPMVYIGSVHVCSFDEYEAVVSPLRMSISEDSILFAESCQIKETGCSLVYEFLFRKAGENSSIFSARFMNAGEESISPDMHDSLMEKIEIVAKSIKAYAEKGGTNLRH